MAGQHLLGGFKEAHDRKSDAHVQQIAQFAVQEINKRAGNSADKQLELVRVDSVHTQVVAGTNYKLVLHAADPSQNAHSYEVTVHEPLGGKDLELKNYQELDKEKSVQRHEESSERAKLGAYKEVSVEDPEVQEAAQFAAEQLSSQSNSLLKFELKEVLTAQTHVVNGKLFDMEIKLKQGDMPEKYYQVEVVRSFKNEFTLKKSSEVSGNSSK